MRFSGLVVLLLTILFSNVNAQKISFSEKRSSYYTYVKGDCFEGLVFSKDFTFPFLDNQVGDLRFTPSNDDIEAAEKLLAKKIKAVNALQLNQGGDKGPVIHENLQKFARQYFGYITESGERVVYISCLLKTPYKSSSKAVPNWLKGAVLVLNGGSNYWQVQANLNKSALFGLDINGLDTQVTH